MKNRLYEKWIGTTKLVCHNSKSKIDLPALDMEVIAIIPTGEGISVGNRIKGQAIFCATGRANHRELAVTFQRAANYLLAAERKQAQRKKF